MKRFFTGVVALLFLSTAVAFAQMSDDAVIAYIRSGIANGKSRSRIATELVAKGVTEAQIKRLMNEYKTADKDMLPSAETNSLNSMKASSEDVFNEKTGKIRRSLAISDNDSADQMLPKEKEDGDKEMDEDLNPVDKNNKNRLRTKTSKNEVKKIYGHDIFKSRGLSFEPNENSATPQSYILGPGDVLLIEVWGENEAGISCTVNPEGKISISQIGPIQVSGLTLAEATAKIKKELSRKYALSGEYSPSKISITIGNVRTIKVNILGEVNTPGSYRLSSLSNVFNALYRAGGVTPIGSLRAIQIVRGGKVAAEADVYKYIFYGKGETNISLCDGDAVIVPPYGSLIEVTGGVKRPMCYEILPSESVENVLKYCGGFSSIAYEDEVFINRLDGKIGNTFTVKKPEYGSFKLVDGDVLSVYENVNKEISLNRVEVKGKVMRPGIYSIGGEIASVRQLVEHAGGLLEDAFKTRAQILREKSDRSLEIVAVPVGAIVDGKADDMLLKKNDVLIISDVNEVEKKGDVVVSGYVLNPGNYEFASGMTVEDLILLAGGLESGASEARVDISRRMTDPYSTHSKDTIAQVFTCQISKGLIVDGGESFVLEPFDIVAVRKSPTFVEQRMVTVSGEVVFPGEYSLVTTADRLSDLYKRAGGKTSLGNEEGAILMRKISESERLVRRNMATAVKRGNIGKVKVDSTVIEKLKTPQIYPVGINLKKALEKPGSSADVILRDGDELVVPPVSGTVRVQGEVLYPNAVTFIPGKPLKYYIQQSGGFSTEAKRAKSYVIHMNGTVSVGLGSIVDSGAEIIVPSKPERAKTTVSEWLGIGTTAASITTMVATISNLMKK